ncbi:MAG TPA: RNA polymerase sigma factor [Acidimicrobiales bacterium]|nr:RNA polymerase sigma factor [Acidimicrobiales bacterium]
MVHPGGRRRPDHGRRSPPRALTYCAGIDPEADDPTLVAAARAGDRDALDALLRRHHDRWWRLCRRMAGNDADGHDALQEALIAVARGIRRYDGRSAFTTWAYRVVTNACLDELRRRARRPLPRPMGSPGLPLGEAAGGPVPAGAGFVAAPDHGGWPGAPASPGDAAVEAVADRLDVDRALARLPEEFRAAVVLRDLCDLDYAEIARVLDVPPGTVRSRIARGRAQLAALLGNPAAPDDRPTPSP